VVDPTLVITISRTELGLGLLTLSAADDGTPLGIYRFRQPSLQRRNNYAPSSQYADGDEQISSSWQQALMEFDWAQEGATEAQVQASYWEIAKALAQSSYTVTTQINGAPVLSWDADSGSMAASDRTYEDLSESDQVYAVTIPVKPIPGGV
jgi:hypothetical protein